VTEDKIEQFFTDLVARFAPWFSPIPTAFLVGRATVLHLGWPDWVGAVAAIIVESLGLATTSTSLMLYQYNKGKNKSHPSAPFLLSAVLVGIYFLTAIVLTVALDTFPSLAAFAPALFPFMSLCGVTVLAIRNDHRLRLKNIKDERDERKAARAIGTPSVPNGTPSVQRGTYQEFLAMQLARNGDGPMPVEQVMAHFGVPSRTAYNWLKKSREAVIA
jgi:hypothetical protein